MRILTHTKEPTIILEPQDVLDILEKKDHTLNGILEISDIKLDLGGRILSFQVPLEIMTSREKLEKAVGNYIIKNLGILTR